jgi:hypothetical protein
MPSMRSVERSLSGLMFPAGSWRTETLDAFHRRAGWPPCQRTRDTLSRSSSAVGAAMLRNPWPNWTRLSPSSLDNLAGKGSVVGYLADVISTGKIEDFGLYEGKVCSVPLRCGEKRLGTPDIIRNAIASGPPQDVLFGHPEPAQRDPFLGQCAQIAGSRRRKQQHERGEVVDARKIEPAIALSPAELAAEIIEI